VSIYALLSREPITPGLSKWFYDTFTGTATRVAHCGSLLEELRSLLLQLWMKQDEHDDFMWFRLSECNTLYPRDELYYYACSLS
jgi:hypothetical protein